MKLASRACVWYVALGLFAWYGGRSGAAGAEVLTTDVGAVSDEATPSQPQVCVVQIMASGAVLSGFANNPTDPTIAVLVPPETATNVPVSCQDLTSIGLGVANQEPSPVSLQITVFTHQGTALCTRGPFTLPGNGARGVVFGSDCVEAQPSVGELVGSVTFSADCASGIGVGITFDGTNLWYSCYASSTDLYKANPTTGQVITSYRVLGGLGALAFDSSRGKIWAAAGCGPRQTGDEVYLIDLATGTARLQFHVPHYTGSCLIDGLGYDGSNDTLYHSYDGAKTIRHLSITGVPQADDNFPWNSRNCYNSGVAIGGSLLYEGSDGCSHVWVVDKVTKAAAFDFSTQVAGDPNFRDEGLTCDNITFAGSGKEVIWSKEAYSPMRAHAFEIPAGSCKFGGGVSNQ